MTALHAVQRTQRAIIKKENDRLGPRCGHHEPRKNFSLKDDLATRRSMVMRDRRACCSTTQLTAGCVNIRTA